MELVCIICAAMLRCTARNSDIQCCARDRINTAAARLTIFYKYSIILLLIEDVPVYTTPIYSNKLPRLRDF